MDAASGAVLAEHNLHARRSPASVTKIMTALLVVERTDLDAVATVPDAVTQLRASTLMGVRPGERLTVRDLLYGLMLPSGNDAAVALATHVAGDEPAFVAMMNQRALALGMRDTQFANSHGLDFRDWGSPYTSAADLALLTRAALQQPEFRTVFGARSYTAHGEQAAYPLRNLNTFLTAYSGADGAKIGWTRRAGNTMVAAATRASRSLIVVVLGSAARDADARRLLDEGFRTPLP
jgi:D-alanyl-D-alanine carboxypeptidase